MKQEIDNWLKAEKEFKNKFKGWLKNKDISLEERWKLFIESGLGEHKKYYEAFDCKLGQEYSDNLEDRYSNERVEYILDYAAENDYPEEEIIQFKENVLSSFIKSYTFDW